MKRAPAQVSDEYKVIIEKIKNFRENFNALIENEELPTEYLLSSLLDIDRLIEYKFNNTRNSLEQDIDALEVISSLYQAALNDVLKSHKNYSIKIANYKKNVSKVSAYNAVKRG